MLVWNVLAQASRHLTLGSFCYTVVEGSLQEDVMANLVGPRGNRSQLCPASLDKVTDMVRNYLGSFSAPPPQSSLPW